MDVSKNVCDGERQFFFEMKEKYKVSCAELLYFAKLLGSWFLFEMLHTCEN